MTALPQRQALVSMITIARDEGARLVQACAELGISVRTFQRWTEEGQVRPDGRPEARRPSPSNKLSPEERAAVLATCMQPRFADMPPTQIVPILADEGVYQASESTMYRILHDNDAQHHRGRARKRTPRQPPTHVARAPNEVWCWDVTYLPSRVRGLFFYLFVVIDLYSRKIVAWEVHGAENGELAAALIEQARWRERLAGKPLILHADNGAAQRSQTLRAKLQDLGIEPSYSRPGVSDDNAYIESLFRTLKYVPAYPSAGFSGLEQARAWTQSFVDWYNGHHRHRGIGFVTPNQRHSGQSTAILARRREVYTAAREANPSRWSGPIRRWSQPTHVALNKREEARKAA
jgi:transposase InsO family protein